MLKQIFILNTDDKQHWFKIILWWELRRVPYNILLVIFGIISLTLLSFIVKDVWSFFPEPFIFYLWIILFLLFANVFYTSGWIFQLLTRNTKSKFILKVRANIFIYGLVFSFFIQLTPSLGTGIYTIVTGEQIKSPYADFTTKEPKWNDIVGEYKISKISKERLHIPDSLANKTLFKLNSDSTFIIKYFPDFSSSNALTVYEIINAKGKWKIEKDQENWVIPMSFYERQNIKSDYTEQAAFHNGNGFKINKNKPPYEIYIMVGNPDSWEGITLERK